MSDYKHFFTFSSTDLLSYLGRHSATCEKLLMHSYDQRSSPNTFMEEYRGKYRVGWCDRDGKLSDVEEFDKLALLAISERHRFQLPITIWILIPALNIESNDILKSGSTAVVKIWRSELNIPERRRAKGADIKRVAAHNEASKFSRPFMFR